MIGWMARSYTRVALPDAFNEALSNSKIDSVLRDKLAKQAEHLFGIYLAISHDGSEEWSGPLGEMPPPYSLGILLVTTEVANHAQQETALRTLLFKTEITAPDGNKTTRAKYAQSFGLRVIEQDVSARNKSAITLSVLNDYVRFSLVDYLSDSSMSSASTL